MHEPTKNLNQEALIKEAEDDLDLAALGIIASPCPYPDCRHKFIYMFDTELCPHCERPV